jgi:hypothetical protein
MVSSVPPIVSGYRGSRRITTLEEFFGPNEQPNASTPEYNINKKKNGRTTHVATNLRLYLNTIISEHNPKGSNNNNNGYQSQRKERTSAKDRHACRGSRWSESEATRRFRAQSKQFDTRSRDFIKRSRPSATELIASIQKKNRTALLHNNNSLLTKTAYQIAQHESSANNQITRQVDDFWRMPAYGKAPGSKPDNCV